MSNRSKDVIKASGSFSKAMLVDVQCLQRLDKQMHELLELGPSGSEEVSFQYTLRYADDTQHQTGDFNSVINDPNLSATPIVGVSLHGARGDVDWTWEQESIELTFGQEWTGETGAFSVTGWSREWVMSVRERVRSTLRSMTLWYGAWLQYVMAIAATVVVWGCVLAVMIWLRRGPLAKEALSENLIELFGLGATIVLGTIGFVFYFCAAKPAAEYLFPLVIFAIGQGKQRHDALTGQRKGCLYIILVVIVLGIILQVLIIPWISALLVK